MKQLLLHAGATNTGAAIRQTSLVGFNEFTGARPATDGVPRILVALTDGYSGDSVVRPSEEVHGYWLAYILYNLHYKV